MFFKLDPFPNGKLVFNTHILYIWFCRLYRPCVFLLIYFICKHRKFNFNKKDLLRNSKSFLEDVINPSIYEV